MRIRLPRELDWQIRVFDSLTFPSLILLPDRTVLSANRVFLQSIDAQEEDVVGRSCREVFRRYYGDTDMPCDEHRCPLASTLESGEGHSILRHLRDRHGDERWEDRVFSPIKGDDGRVAYVIESIRDVTRVKTLERMYADVRQFLNRVIHSSPSAIVAAERGGRILLMNPAAEDLFGYTLQEALNTNIRDLYPEGKAREIMRQLRAKGLRKKPGKLPPFRVDIVTATGEPVPVEMTAAIVYDEGREVATMGIYNDLRERLAVERQLKDAQAQVMQSEKMASLGRLAAGVAHEINNPLTGILLYGAMMQEELREDDPVWEKLSCVLEDATRCRDIVKGLLAYSRQTTAHKQVFPVNDLVQESLSLIRDQKLFLNVELRKELSAEELLIYGDRQQLSQAIINLVMNALDAMNHQGTLTIRTRRGLADERIGIEIADTGCGIPEEDRSRIFDPFFTTKAPGEGTGLGLSTVYGIVEKCGGCVAIKETGPEGTTFVLELPAAPADAVDGFASIG